MIRPAHRLIFGSACALGMAVACQAQTIERLNPAHDAYPPPRPTVGEASTESEEAAPNDSLSAAIVDTFSSNPELAARRYDLRATDDEVGIAMSQTRPQVRAQVSGGYDLTLPGAITQSNRPLSDRLNYPNIERNSLTSQLIIDQPISTGGRATTALRSALANSAVGRETLRGAEADLLVDLIAAYSDVRRDRRSLAIRQRNLRTLEATLAEIVARRDAGELTRTDIAQAETQLQAARVQLNAAEAQLETSRASFTAIVGRDPGNLAPEPNLPNLPRSAAEAFAMAELANPDLAAAIATERVSHERIAAAQAEGRPELSIRGTAGTTGPALPFDRTDHDILFAGQATLSIPLFAGGRVRSLVAQARNRQSADALRIEAIRREVTQAIINAWNQWVSAERDVRAQTLQVQAASIFYEGTLAEYREGLRSTFDVLYAQNSLNETQIALLSSKRDHYVAQAVLLRHLGKLATDSLLVNGPSYDPGRYLQTVRQRSAIPWGGVIRTIDGLDTPIGRPKPITMPERKTNAILAPSEVTDAPRKLLRGRPGTTSDQVPAPSAQEASQ